MAVEQPQPSSTHSSAVWPPTCEKVRPMPGALRQKGSMRCSASVKETMPTYTTAWHTWMRAVAAKAQRSLKVML